jgi:hypothetical protein
MRAGSRPMPASRAGATSFSFPRFRSRTNRSAARSRSARRWAGSLRWWSWPRAPGSRVASLSRTPVPVAPIGRRGWGHWRGGHGGTRRAHGQGNARRRAGPSAARRRAHVFRPAAVHPVRRLCRAARPRGQIRLHGGEPGSPDTVAVKITEAIGRLRTVPPDGDLVQTARMLGMSFGDE